MNDPQTEHTFRLIAVRTGSKLSDQEKVKVAPAATRHIKDYDYLKLLEPNTAFTFFSCYEVKQDGDVLEYKAENDIVNLYALEKNKGVNVEVSAIVGKNGSGKSTLLEIIYLAAYNLSVAKEVLVDSDHNKVNEYWNYLRCDLIFQVEKHKYIRLKFCFDDNDHQCYVIESSTTNNKKFTFDKPVAIDKYKLEEFFYNIVVNYSIYGLNNLRTGNWINLLFHKNDSYQTPIVINPKRNEGNFNINEEEGFTRERLIANTVIKYNKSTEKSWVTDLQYLDELVFKVNDFKIEFLEKEDDNANGQGFGKTREIEELIKESGLSSAAEVTKKALHEILGIEDGYDKVNFKDEIELYIVKKLYRIAFIYKKYYEFLEYETYDKPTMIVSTLNSKKLDAYFLKLKDDHSHVTTKLRQALNYLVNDPLKKDDTHDWVGKDRAAKTFTITFNDFAKRLDGLGDKVIEYLPPSLFKLHIGIKNKDTGKPSALETLSSGELQLINSVQSSLYHLNNLESYKEESGNEEKIKHRNVLLIFDEIELYFHPEFQRKMVAYLLKEIDSLNLGLVKYLHILFVTHSPFILSDIPRGRLLKLDKGKPKYDEEPTFAANIYELLKSSFFLESGTGEHAVKVINDLLKEMNKILLLKRNPRINKDELVDCVALLKSSCAGSIISSIGDDLIRKKMFLMYDDCVKTSKAEQKKRIRKEIERLNDKLKGLS